VVHIFSEVWSPDAVEIATVLSELLSFGQGLESDRSAMESLDDVEGEIVLVSCLHRCHYSGSRANVNTQSIFFLRL